MRMVVGVLAAGLTIYGCLYLTMLMVEALNTVPNCRAGDNRCTLGSFGKGSPRGFKFFVPTATWLNGMGRHVR
jgi:hypothetical protein